LIGHALSDEHARFRRFLAKVVASELVKLPEALAFSTLSKAMTTNRLGGVPSRPVILLVRTTYFPPNASFAGVALGPIWSNVYCVCLPTASVLPG
jgi:hypothetical protein